MTIKIEHEQDGPPAVQLSLRERGYAGKSVGLLVRRGQSARMLIAWVEELDDGTQKITFYKKRCERLGLRVKECVT